MSKQEQLDRLYAALENCRNPSCPSLTSDQQCLFFVSSASAIPDSNPLHHDYANCTCVGRFHVNPQRLSNLSSKGQPTSKPQVSKGYELYFKLKLTCHRVTHLVHRGPHNRIEQSPQQQLLQSIYQAQGLRPSHPALLILQSLQNSLNPVNEDRKANLNHQTNHSDLQARCVVALINLTVPILKSDGLDIYWDFNLQTST